MMIVAKNIKKLNGTWKLGKRTIVTGKHESGKSALLEAIRLAITGKADIGGTGQKISEIVSDKTALAAIGSSRWTIKNGDTVSCKHEGPKQKVPISPEQFWGLTSAQKFALVCPVGLQTVGEAIENIKSEIKKHKEIADQPPPEAPDLYTGLPREELLKKIGSLTIEIHQHQEASKSTDAAIIKSLERQIELTEKGIAKEGQDVARLQESKSIIEKEISDLNNLINASMNTGEPGLLRKARLDGKKIGEFVHEVAAEMQHSCEYLADRTEGHAKVEMLSCEILFGQVRQGGVIDQPIPEPQFEGKDKLPPNPLGRLGELNRELTSTIDTIAIHQKYITRLNEQLRTLNIDLSLKARERANILADDVFESIVNEKQELEKQLEKCNAWESFGETTGEFHVKRSLAIGKIDELNEKLVDLLKERNELVASTAGPVEEVANQILTAMGLPQVKIEVEATAKKAELSIRTSEGIALDALAGSRKLIYSMTVLLGVQSISSEPSPFMVAECAEINGELLCKFIQSIPESVKSYVVLEHWTEVDAGPDITHIRMEN